MLPGTGACSADCWRWGTAGISRGRSPPVPSYCEPGNAHGNGDLCDHEDNIKMKDDDKHMAENIKLMKETRMNVCVSGCAP